MIKHDVVIVGSGVAGMRAAIEIRRRLPEADIAVITKMYPTRSQSSSVRDGIAAALGNVRYDMERNVVVASENAPADDWVIHMHDTIKSADFLGDQDAIEVLCHGAPAVVYELEHMGVPFSRLPDGRIAQRAFGGHTNPRSCYAADHTGHAILQTLYGELIRYNIKVYPEWYMLGVVIEDALCRGITVMDVQTGELDAVQARATVFATGGYGRTFRMTTSALTTTGDGLAAAFRAGIPLEDLEFVQFHPLSLYRHGLWISTDVLYEGSYLLNGANERFMQRYAPGRLELAPTDLLIQALYTEIEAGRGAGPDGDHLLLDVRHLDQRTLDQRLPHLVEVTRDYLGLDLLNDLVPVQPAAHFAMGGIPTDVDGRVITTVDGTDQIVTGFFAAGECACVSVHGAGLLATNSLLEAVLFGRRVGQTVATFLADEVRGKRAFAPIPPNLLQQAEDEVNELLSRNGHEFAADIRSELQATMYANTGIARSPSGLTQQLGIIQELRERFGYISVDDRGRYFNTELIENLELAHLLEFAECIVAGALARQETRGSHVRSDFPQRDDTNWTKHTLAFRRPNGRPQLAYKPVRYGPNGPRLLPEASRAQAELSIRR